MTILSKEMIDVIETTNAMIETNRNTNKANSEAINKGNIDIYATTVASFSKYKADTISTKDVKIFRGQCSDDCFLSPSKTKKVVEKTQWVFEDFKKNKVFKSWHNLGYAEIVTEIKNKFEELGITSEAKLIKHFDPKRQDQSDVEKLVEKILGRPSKNEGGWVGGLDARDLRKFEEVFEATKDAKDEMNGKGAKAEKTKKEEQKINEEVNECSDILVASANADNQADLDNNPF
tara:strand:- start:734 stop:1432 length:699 start_codon:yes stop_codon:yes gene_type:complete